MAAEKSLSSQRAAMLENAKAEDFKSNIITTSVDSVVAWCQKNSLWPMPMGLSCCAIEMMAMVATRFDLARFGAEAMRFTPRQSDMMIVAGTVTKKMAKPVKLVYEQMAEPKWVISMGVCATSGGMFNVYSVLQGVDQIIPVDIYVAGCPPRPENVIYAVMKLQEKIKNQASPLRDMFSKKGRYPALAVMQDIDRQVEALPER